jgi:hypothetical protein
MPLQTSAKPSMHVSVKIRGLKWAEATIDSWPSPSWAVMMSINAKSVASILLLSNLALNTLDFTKIVGKLIMNSLRTQAATSVTLDVGRSLIDSSS